MSFVAFFSRIGTSFALETFSGRYPFSSVIFLMGSATHLPPLVWQKLLLLLTQHFKSQTSLKLSNHLFLALSSSASPSFCFKLSYNGFALKKKRIRVYSLFITIQQLHKSLREHGILRKRSARFSGLLEQLKRKPHGFPLLLFLFLFFYNGPYTGLIYLELVGNRSCRPQSMVHIQQFTFSCNA